MQQLHTQSPLSLSIDLDTLEVLWEELCDKATMAMLLVIRKEWTVPAIPSTDSLINEMARVESLVIV